MPIDKKDIARIESRKRAKLRSEAALKGIESRKNAFQVKAAETVTPSPLDVADMGLHCEQLAKRIEDTRAESLFEGEFKPSSDQACAEHHYLQGLSYLELAMREFKRAATLCKKS